LITIKNIDKVEAKKTNVHGEALYKVLFDKDTLKAMTGFWQTVVNPNIALPPHSHEDEEQIYFILEGNGVVTVGGEKERVKKGDAIYLPIGINHGFINDSDKPCLILAVGAKVHT
jgi:quercetin dioxygenase-like cupin family protein